MRLSKQRVISLSANLYRKEGYMIPNVAIIDTGIDPKAQTFKNLDSYIELFVENDTIYLRDEPIIDKDGHGSCVAFCINKHCKDARLHVINIYGEKPITYSALLHEALIYLLDKNVDIINISLSVDGSTYKKEIEEALHQLFMQGKAVVCSVKNGEKSSFPANNDDCIGVMGSYDIDFNDVHTVKNNIQLIACGKPEEITYADERSMIFCGSSKATADVSGMLACFRAKCSKDRWTEYITNKTLTNAVFSQNQSKDK